MATKKIQILGTITDTTLTESGRPADAKAVGEKLAKLEIHIDETELNTMLEEVLV